MNSAKILKLKSENKMKQKKSPLLKQFYKPTEATLISLTHKCTTAQFPVLVQAIQLNVA